MNATDNSHARPTNVVILTGAGVSAESGIKTFRDADGLWENYPVMDVCSADGFRRNPALVHEFYNQRRRQLATVEPNAAHMALARLARDPRYNVTVITQNVDNLHELAGSPSVLHLHGELMKVRAMDDPDLLFDMTADNPDTTPDTVIDGHHVRPHIVFFQEGVPAIEDAIDIVGRADMLVIIGTSFNVYPAAGLVAYAPAGIPVIYIDPKPASVPDNVTVLPVKATEGVPELVDKMLD